MHSVQIIKIYFLVGKKKGTDNKSWLCELYCNNTQKACTRQKIMRIWQQCGL